MCTRPGRFGEDVEAGTKDRSAAESVENDRAYVKALDEEEIWEDGPMSGVMR